VLFAASLPLGTPPVPTPSNLGAVRGALAQWGVTTIVVPDQPGLPLYEQGRSVAYAVGLFTAAVGRPPVYDHSAWVWSGVTRTGPAVSVTAAAFDACVTTTDNGSVPACILAAGR
jgi:hypothetical protein